MMKYYLTSILAIIVQFQLFSQYRDFEWAGDHKIDIYKAFGWVKKDWVRYTLNKDGTALVYRDGFPDIKHNAHIYIEDTVIYKKKRYIVTEIEDCAWKGAHRVLSVRLPKNIKRIPVEAFSGCQTLSKIKFPDSLEYIGSWAFYQVAIDSLIVPENVTFINEYAFHECRYLRYIVLPENIRKIGDMAFDDCPTISSVTVKSKIPIPIGERTFSISAYKGGTLFVPSGSLTLYRNSEGWKKFKNIEEY
jgi:hypothetical protein